MDEFWFKEGFTDFFTAQILLECKIWNIKDYINFYNKRIYEYYAFGMNSYKLNEMYNKFIYNESGYISGALYALSLNEFIINNSNNTIVN